MSYSREEIPREKIEEAINNSNSMIAAARYLGVSRDRFNRYAKKYGLFNPNQPGIGIPKGIKYKTKEDVFCESGIRRDMLLEWVKREKEWKCEKCGLNTWQGSPLPLEIHHIDGNRRNHDLSNLQILCPNCHSQTSNWRSRNQKGYTKTTPKVTDEELLAALKDNESIRAALKSLGLTGSGNYKRVTKLLMDQLKK